MDDLVWYPMKAVTSNKNVIHDACSLVYGDAELYIARAQVADNIGEPPELKYLSKGRKRNQLRYR